MYCSKLSDQELVYKYIQGDEKSLEALVNRHQPKIFSFIISKVRDYDLANDLFQDTFIKVINTLKAGRYNEEGKFLPWVMRIAHNLVIDHFRKEKRVPVYKNNHPEFDIFDFVAAEEDNVESEIIMQQIYEDVKALLPHLPEEQRQVLEMRIFQKLSFKEIAETTDVSINTALGRMRYALINLRKIVDQHQIVLTQ